MVTEFRLLIRSYGNFETCIEAVRGIFGVVPSFEPIDKSEPSKGMVMSFPFFEEAGDIDEELVSELLRMIAELVLKLIERGVPVMSMEISSVIVVDDDGNVLNGPDFEELR